MTPLAAEDELVDLWQSASAIDTTIVLQNVARQIRSQRHQTGLIAGVLVCASLLLAFAEATGGLRTHGLLSLLWLIGLGVGALRHRSARRRAVEILSLGTRQMLQISVVRAERGLTLARCLFAGTPVGALAGYAIVLTSHIGVAVTHRPLGMVQAVAGSMLLLIMVGSGLIFARMRKRELMMLREAQLVFEQES